MEKEYHVGRIIKIVDAGYFKPADSDFPEAPINLFHVFDENLKEIRILFEKDCFGAEVDAIGILEYTYLDVVDDIQDGLQLQFYPTVDKTKNLHERINENVAL